MRELMMKLTRELMMELRRELMREFMTLRGNL